MAINIRLANEMDAEQIAAVHIASWQAIYKDLMPPKTLNNLSLEKRTAEWHERLTQGVKIWVLELSSQIIGFASICPSRDKDIDPTRVVEISAFYLLPKFWRLGYGKKLCNHVINYLKQTKYKELTLWVLETNQIARNFYEKMDFKATHDYQTETIDGELLREVRYKLSKFS